MERWEDLEGYTRTTKFENGLTALYLKNQHNTPDRKPTRYVCQRLVFFRIERAERVERIEWGGDGERTGTGGIDKMFGEGETGADLVV